MTDRITHLSDPTWIAGRVLHSQEHTGDEVPEQNRDHANGQDQAQIQDQDQVQEQAAPGTQEDNESSSSGSSTGAGPGDGADNTSGNGPGKPVAPRRPGQKPDEKIDIKALLTGKPFPGEEPPKGPDGKRRIPLRTIIAYVVMALLLAFLLYGIFGDHRTTKPDELLTSEFVTAVNEDRVYEATYKATDLTLSGTYWRSSEAVGDENQLVEFTSTYLGTDNLAELMAAHPSVKYSADVSQPPAWIRGLTSFLPMLLFLGVMVWWLFRMQDPNSGAMQFGKTKALTNAATRPKVSFKDVAGCDEAIEELQEIKDFLSDPSKFEKLGAKIPRGVLLVGPPGTGKTLLAKAVAGEAGVPFFSISGSDFVEMFVGVGASRVRDLFKNAKEQSPSIIFIDEIDAVGRQRGAGLGGGHDEREQTLNQLLVEMDGFEEHVNVIMIAATNRPDILDPALLRPGRFDRQITVDRPDVAGREAILKIHARNKPLAAAVELDKIAKLTPGFSGADLGNLMNESALLAARRAHTSIVMDDINEAMERVIAGPQRKSRIMTETERRTIAYHESGHALVGHNLPNADPVHKISIIPRGQALGYTLSLPEEDHFLQTRQSMTEDISVLLGGRVAEELFCGDITSGASNDLERVTKIAKAMVMRLGMSDKMGTQVFGEANHEVFLGRDLGERSNYSPETAHAIDQEVSRIISEAHEVTRKILSERSDQMHLMARVLLERETVDGKAATALLDNKWDEYLATEAAESAAAGAAADGGLGGSDSSDSGTAAGGSSPAGPAPHGTSVPADSAAPAPGGADGSPIPGPADGNGTETGPGSTGPGGAGTWCNSTSTSRWDG